MPYVYKFTGDLSEFSENDLYITIDFDEEKYKKIIPSKKSIDLFDFNDVLDYLENLDKEFLAELELLYQNNLNLKSNFLHEDDYGNKVFFFYIDGWLKYGYLFPLFLKRMELVANKKYNGKITDTDQIKNIYFPSEKDGEQNFDSYIDGDLDDDVDDFDEFGNEYDEEENEYEESEEKDLDALDIPLPEDYIEPFFTSRDLEKMININSRSRFLAIKISEKVKEKTDKPFENMKKFNVELRSGFVMNENQVKSKNVASKEIGIVDFSFES